MAKRRCHAITKKGEKCRAAPLKDGEHCLAHADQQTRESVGFRADNGKGGRPRNPRAVDVLRERIERGIDEVLNPLWEGLAASRGVTIALKGGGAEFYETPDYSTRIAAAREILDRGYGKPKQATEITGADGGPIETTDAGDLDALNTEEVREYRRLRAKALRAVA